MQSSHGDVRMNVPRLEMGREGQGKDMVPRGRNGWRISPFGGRVTIVVIHSLGSIWLFVIPWTVACQAPLSSAISWSLLKFMSIESVMLSNHLILCHPLLLLPSIFPSIRGFSTEAFLLIRWPKYWSFSGCPSNEYSALISFRIDLFDLFTVQGTLKNLLQHYNLKASILQRSAFFIVQLSQLYMTTGKIIALTIQTFVGKVMSLLFNTLSRFVIAYFQGASIF